MLFAVITKLLDSLFPRVCMGCGHRLVDDRITHGILCVLCNPKNSKPTRFMPDGYYGYRYEGILKKLIHELKFRHRKDMLAFLRDLLHTELFKTYDYVIPVPSHWIRQLEHGGDPIKLIFSKVNNIRTGLIKRSQYTRAFHSLGKLKRAEEIKGVFSVTSPRLIKGSRILVVDDIYTTGATFRELKRILLAHGAQRVEGYFFTKS